jgi:hypothetical protein
MCARCPIVLLLDERENVRTGSCDLTCHVSLSCFPLFHVCGYSVMATISSSYEICMRLLPAITQTKSDSLSHPSLQALLELQLLRV